MEQPLIESNAVWFEELRANRANVLTLRSMQITTFMCS
jgi:hypothetical protein